MRLLVKRTPENVVTSQNSRIYSKSGEELKSTLYTAFTLLFKDQDTSSCVKFEIKGIGSALTLEIG
jgi:hypothetical protein